MRTPTRLAGIACVALLAASTVASAQEHDLPPARSIPGITAEDAHPGGCVDCHVADPARNLDVRFSTLFRLWNERPDSTLLALLQPLAPSGVTLTGAHPTAAFVVADIPKNCLTCHGRDSKVAPSLASMVHRIHLTGGESNVFLTVYQGECTHCHKLETETGTWRMASGPERP